MLKHNDPTPSTIDGYLQELRRRLEAELPVERVDDLVAETESHLREREFALRELESEAPELEAVSGFVQASHQARELAESDAADRWALLARRARTPLFLSLLAYPIAAPFLGRISHTFENYLPVAVVSLLGLGAVASFVGRRADSRRLRRLTLVTATTAGVLFGVAFVDGTANNPAGGTRWETFAQARRWEAIADEYDRQVGEITAEWRSWTRDGHPVRDYPEGSAPYLVPPLSPNVDGAVVNSKAEALEAWRTRGKAWLPLLQQRVAEARATQREYAAAARSMPSLTIGGVAFAVLLILGFSALLVDLGFSRVGAHLHQRRRTRRRRI